MPEGMDVFPSTSVRSYQRCTLQPPRQTVAQYAHLHPPAPHKDDLSQREWTSFPVRPSIGELPEVYLPTTMTGAPPDAMGSTAYIHRPPRMTLPKGMDVPSKYLRPLASYQKCTSQSQ